MDKFYLEGGAIAPNAPPQLDHCYMVNKLVYSLNIQI